MIEIGETKVATRRPVDLDAALLAATGCTAAEHAAMLVRGGTAFQVAQVLAPFTDSPAGELAALIGPDELNAARLAVIGLLVPTPSAPAKADAK